ncbi:MAG: hypothetical protein HY681_13995 [Chloroflexi bacterium]|nr:hypothetical protein [Chloroflexota bacterium]
MVGTHRSRQEISRRGAAQGFSLFRNGGLWLVLALAALQALAAACGNTLTSFGAPLPTPSPLAKASVLSPQYVTSLTDGLTRPMAVAVSSRGDIYVADGGCRCVRVFDAVGLPSFTIGPTFEPGVEMQYPVALALDGEDTLYVSDLSMGRILIFRNREYVGPLTQGDVADAVTAPAGILLDHGMAYVNDLSLHQVLMFRQEDWSLIQAFGAGKGTAPGSLTYPNFSIVLPDGSLLVADSNNNRLQQFAPDGSVQHVWAAGLILPRGIATDSAGNIIVASALEGQLDVFARDGKYLGGVRQFTGSPEELGSPVGIAVHTNKVYVADRINGTVQIGVLE